MAPSLAESTSTPLKRLMLSVAVMLATIMQAVDTTIANVALPQMQGAMGATQDQISWVLTSYIVAAAMFIPLSGFLADRLGRRKVFIVSVVGFTVASMLCGMAQNLSQVVLFRLFQGICGASLVPLSQAVMLDTYPPAQRGSAMAWWGVGVMVGPVVGPTIGGWLTEYYSWRWVFYINVPFGLLAWLGLMAYLPETPTQRNRKFDYLGFVLLTVAIASLQMMLDRGESQDWFNSREIMLEAMLAVLSFYLFLVHIFTAKETYVEPALFRDRNFCLGLLFISVVVVSAIASSAILPSYLHAMYGYPIIDIGLLLAPRGIAMMVGMFFAGRFSHRVDIRYSIFTGFLLTGFSLWEMTHFSVALGEWEFIRISLLQGLGMGMIFVPLSIVTFSTLSANFRNEGTALYSLMRNIGASVGISVVVAYLSQHTQANHAVFSEHISSSNLALRQLVEQGAIHLDSTASLLQLNNMVSRQAALLAYLQDFRFMMWITLAVVPLVLLLKKIDDGAAPSTSSLH